MVIRWFGSPYNLPTGGFTDNLPTGDFSCYLRSGFYLMDFIVLVDIRHGLD